MIEMIPGTVTLATLEEIWRKGTPARLAASARPGGLWIAPQGGLLFGR